MAESIDKDKIFLEIRQTIKFLLRERDQGKDKFEISDFFHTGLEDEILNNFDNAISRKEYEETVLALFGAKRAANISLGAVRREVDKLIRRYRMRSKKQILQKLIVQFQPVPSDVQLLRDYVIESYNKAMKEPLKLKIASYVKEGTTNLRNVMSILRREKYDIDRSFVKEILEKLVRDAERTRSRLQRGKPKGRSSVKKFATVKPHVDTRDKLREQMKKSLIRKTKSKKSRFIREKCPKFRFELTENIVDDNIRTLIYSGKKGTTAINVKTILDNDKITDVEILCLKKGNKKPSILSVEAFLKAIEQNQKDIFLQNWLKSVNKQIKFSNVQELIWYLQSILNERFNLPEGVANYLEKRLVQHLMDLDLNLTKYVIEKALENV